MRFLFWLVAIVICVSAVPSKDQVRKFPDDFLFGTATASYQIEGGWNADGKGENVWDHITHNYPKAITDMSNGDIAADSYNNYERDVEKMRELGLDVYRFSISWARVLPNGMSNVVNEAGVAYYNNLINEMLKYNIVPMVTIYHWDLPQKLEDLGGFTNPLLADWFEDYARVLYERFGDRVKHWITFNEPREICHLESEQFSEVSMLNTPGIGFYLCARSLLMAHAKAFHLYNLEFRSTQKGQVGITVNTAWHGPESEEDEYAAEIKRQAMWGIFIHPIFSNEGGFPKEFSERVAEKSNAQGYIRSRMPDLSNEEKDFIKGSSDFLGINHYCALIITSLPSDEPSPSFTDDIGFQSYMPEEWPSSASPWLKQSPNSLYNILTHLQTRYNNPPMYITENGWSTSPEASLVDDDRVTYYRAAWENVLDALDAGVNLKGYMAWSLLDNFEWMQGYSERFGLYEVNFEDPARTVTAKKSALVYKDLIKKRYIDYEYDPEDLTMSIDEGH